MTRFPMGMSQHWIHLAIQTLWKRFVRENMSGDEDVSTELAPREWIHLHGSIVSLPRKRSNAGMERLGTVSLQRNDFIPDDVYPHAARP